MLTAFPIGAGKSQSHATLSQSFGLWRKIWPAKKILETTLASLLWVTDPSKVPVIAMQALRQPPEAHFPLAPHQARL
jgi:hypothetical protein